MFDETIGIPRTAARSLLPCAPRCKACLALSIEQLFYLSDLFGVAVFAITALMAGRKSMDLFGVLLVVPSSPRWAAVRCAT